MDDIKLLMKRVAAEVTSLGVELVRFVVIPNDEGGPDHIACSFEVRPEAVKSTDELNSERLENDFFSILGGMTAEESDDGSVVLSGGGEVTDEETEEDRAERTKLRDDRLKRIREDLLGENDWEDD
jgi:hypothetical protein